MADDDAPPGVPEWVVTYGDMMSLLLTFFIMLVSLSEVRANKKYRAVLDSVQKQMGYQGAPVSPLGENFPLNSSIEQEDQPLGSFLKKKASGGIKTPEAAVGEDLRVYMNRPGRSLMAGSPIQFPPGVYDTLEIDPKSLAALVSELAGKPNKIELRGHASPSSKDPRELTKISYERARLVHAKLLEMGIERERLRVVAMADLEPLAHPEAVPGGGADRVEIVLLDVFSKELRGPRAADASAGPPKGSIVR